MRGRVTPRGFRLRATSRSVGLGALSVVVLLGAWHLVTAGGYNSAGFLPPPQQGGGQAPPPLSARRPLWHGGASGPRGLAGVLPGAGVGAAPRGVLPGARAR